jgi:hypothetical protein
MIGLNKPKKETIKNGKTKKQGFLTPLNSLYGQEGDI